MEVLTNENYSEIIESWHKNVNNEFIFDDSLVKDDVQRCGLKHNIKIRINHYSGILYKATFKTINIKPDFYTETLWDVGTAGEEGRGKYWRRGIVLANSGEEALDIMKVEKRKRGYYLTREISKESYLELYQDAEKELLLIKNVIK